MTKLGDVLVVTGCFLLGGVMVKLDADREREMLDAERQIATAADVPCPPREGYRVVASVAMDGQEWARMCGYYRTVIESVRVTWERAK